MTQTLAARATSTAVGIVAVAIVLCVVYWDGQHTSPGEVTAVHARHPELAGADHCDVCHGRDGESMADACMNCHDEIQHQNATGKGFHAGIESEIVDDCSRCHSEHHGSEFRITSQRSFAIAGIPNPEQFDHQGLDFNLTGRHEHADCESCHPNANVDILPVGGKRFLGLSQDCTSCHQDVHQGTFGPDCASCHGQEHPFPRVAQFIHTLAFELVGSHGNAACTDCHRNDTTHSIGVLVAAPIVDSKKNTSVRNCRQCHDSPHNEETLASIALDLGLPNDNSCGHCHPAVHTSFSGTRTFDKSLHSHTGFQLTHPHENLTCNVCHVGFGQEKSGQNSFHQSYPGRHPDDCSACHGDHHQGQFESGIFRNFECIDCHYREQFSPSRFTPSVHQQTRFPLRGAHVNADCRNCHLVVGQPSDGGTVGHHAASEKVAEVARAKTVRYPLRRFSGTSTSCKSCHQDPHAGQFETGPLRGSDCNACHDEHTFAQSTFSIEKHTQSNFALTGAHAAVACVSCHSRTEGQVDADCLVFHTAPTKCNACHADVHEGRFDLPHLPISVAGKTDCARCHTTDSFNDVKSGGFDHSLWTGYELSGPHAKARCVDCHGTKGESDRTSLANDRLDGAKCQSCHQDPHADQFGPTMTVDCSRCHLVGSSFKELAFDHQIHSRFKIDRNHQLLDCSACHQRQHLTSGRTAIRYKPLGTDCGDCHVPVGPRGPRHGGVR